VGRSSNQSDRRIGARLTQPSRNPCQFVCPTVRKFRIVGLFAFQAPVAALQGLRRFYLTISRTVRRMTARRQHGRYTPHHTRQDAASHQQSRSSDGSHTAGGVFSFSEDWRCLSGNCAVARAAGFSGCDLRRTVRRSCTVRRIPANRLRRKRS
jgi:hypothetical protein